MPGFSIRPEGEEGHNKISSDIEARLLLCPIFSLLYYLQLPTILAANKKHFTDSLRHILDHMVRQYAIGHENASVRGSDEGTAANNKAVESAYSRLDASSKMLESKDGKSRIKPVIRSGIIPDRVEVEKGTRAAEEPSSKARPVLIVGFPSVGLVGSICANYIIEKKDMHQIAFVDSEHVVPSAIYIGGRLRHPFRIYSDNLKTLYVVVCEAPLMPAGVHSIMDLMIAWASRN